MIYVSAALLALLLVAAGIRDVYRKRVSRLPPGPTGLPLLGNVLQLPQQFLHRKLHTWSKEFGPIYTFWIMSQPFVVLGGVEVAADVLDRMSAVTSDRPPMIKLREFYFQDMGVMMQDRTLIWRAQRRAIHANLNVRATARFNQMQAHDAAYLTLGLLQHPEIPFHHHVHRFAASIIFGALYGGKAIPLLGPDPSKLIEELTDEGMHATMPQHSVVDMLPVLKPLIKRVKWLRKQADSWYSRYIQEAIRLYDGAVATDAWGTTTIVQELINNGEKYEVSRLQSIWMTGALFMAGQESSHTVLRVFALAMLHHPHIAQAAQAQLDAVCGNQPPTFDDQERLPYIQSVVKETMRWKVIAVLGLPHMASEEFEYKGYVIPKGTILLDNLWSQTHDASVYSDPDNFDPGRFLDASGRLRPATPDTRTDLAFGHGRRVCPGRDFALDGLFIACAYILWAFDLGWPVDEDGKDIVCGENDYLDKGTIPSPLPFGVALKPRKEGLQERLLGVMML